MVRGAPEPLAVRSVRHDGATAIVSLAELVIGDDAAKGQTVDVLRHPWTHQQEHVLSFRVERCMVDPNRGGVPFSVWSGTLLGPSTPCAPGAP